MGTCGLRGPAPAPKGKTMKKTVREVSKLCGISVRTLHYYDEIGLLHPSEVTPAGYRLYGREELSRLQQILFFRELDFSLKEIAEIMNDPAFDARKALLNQKELLLLRQRRLGRLISLVDKTLEGETKMSFEEFDMSEIREAQEKYADEAKQRWGGTEAYRESASSTRPMKSMRALPHIDRKARTRRRCRRWWENGRSTSRAIFTAARMKYLLDWRKCMWRTNGSATASTHTRRGLQSLWLPLSGLMSA